MEYRVLGQTGVKVAPLCLGTDNFANPTPEAESIKIINRALDAGINICMLPVFYERGGFDDSPLEGGQLRFGS